MRAIICGGGTAGHIMPGIAIAETILKNEPDSKILFVAREGGEENTAITRKGYALKTVKIRGFKRSLSLSNIKTALIAFDAYKSAKKIIKEFKPSAVIGTGGYVCWPVIKAAQRLKIPSLIHESNVFPGLTTKLLASGCSRVLLNFSASEKEFKTKNNIRIVGIPLLDELINETKQSARKRLRIPADSFVILSFGGSGGAKIMNENIIKLMENYSTKLGKIRHFHASGKKYYARIQALHPSLTKGKNGAIIYPYIDDMPIYMRSADIVICRAGAMTLSEVAAAGVVPILIPSPNVTDNHQYKNGKLFADKGAAIMIEEHELSERTLLDAVRYLESNVQIRKSMSESLSRFSSKNSRNLIYSEIKSAIEEN